jgi:hypothetical protein
MKKLIIPSLFLFLSACSVNSDEVKKPDIHQAESVGPFSVVFNNDAYTHTFKAQIGQEAGSVEYNIQTANATTIELVDTALKVQGCNARDVQHQIFWIPDSKNNPNIGVAIGVKNTFMSRAGTQGTLRHTIRRIGNCTSLELTTALKAKSAPAVPCKESTDTSCKVAVYCKEKGDYSSYSEVEVWNERWGTTLRQYMNHGDGSRSLMAMMSAVLSDQTNRVLYTSSNPVASLSVEKNTGAGIFKEVFNGTEMNLKLNCQILN